MHVNNFRNERLLAPRDLNASELRFQPTYKGVRLSGAQGSHLAPRPLRLRRTKPSPPVDKANAGVDAQSRLLVSDLLTTQS